MVLTDAQIIDLIKERKHLPENFVELLRSYKIKAKHKEAQLNIVGENKSEFTIIIRQNTLNSFDFSVILGYKLPATKNKIFHLRRYNGRHPSPHTNKLEARDSSNRRFVNTCHIHMATERYQRHHFKEEDYAEETDRYATVEGALRCMLTDCNFSSPKGGFLTGYVSK